MRVMSAVKNGAGAAMLLAATMGRSAHALAA